MFKSQDILKLEAFKRGLATRKRLAELERVRQLPKPAILKLPTKKVS